MIKEKIAYKNFVSKSVLQFQLPGDFCEGYPIISLQQTCKEFFNQHFQN